MAVQVDVYNHFIAMVGNADMDLGAGTFKMALVTSSYTYSAAHTQWSDASANEISGTGYTTGGETITSLAATQTGGAFKWDFDNVLWSTATLTCRRGILRLTGSHGGLTDPLAMSILFNDAPADVSVTATDFQVNIHADGAITIS